MLHDPSHRPQPIATDEIILQPSEKEVLRRLVGELAQIAAWPVHREKAELWRRLNDLESIRPMVWINEIPWHEMNVNDELTLRTQHPWAREWETTLRQTLYQWRHLPADMILNDYLECPLAIHSTDFGILEDVDVVKTDEANPIVSRHFNIQIRDWPDLDKIQMPIVTHVQAATAEHFRVMSEVCAGLIPVHKVGQTHIWFTPWDYLIRWWGVAEAMLDLHERPELVHAAVDRMVAAWNTELDQFVAQHLLSSDANNTRIGSGGYGYTRSLPNPGGGAIGMEPKQMWGCSNAQIFSDVSPDMHWEFALKHDLPWLSRWGLTWPMSSPDKDSIPNPDQGRLQTRHGLLPGIHLLEWFCPIYPLDWSRTRLHPDANFKFPDHEQAKNRPLNHRLPWTNSCCICNTNLSGWFNSILTGFRDWPVVWRRFSAL